MKRLGTLKDRIFFSKTVILHGNIIDKELIDKLIISKTTNYFIFNFIKTPSEPIKIKDNITLIDIKHIEPTKVFEIMFENNIPFINPIHKLYYFNIISNFYKYIIINEYFESNNFYSILNSNILFTRLSFYMDNYLVLSTIKYNKTFIINDYSLLQDLFLIFTTNDFIKFFKTVGSLSIIEYLSSFSNITHKFPEKILYDFLISNNTFSKYESLSFNNFKFKINYKKYSKDEFIYQVTNYIKYAMDHDKLLTFELLNNKIINIDLKDNKDQEKIDLLEFNFVKYSSPDNFSIDDLKTMIVEVFSKSRELI